MNYKQPIQSQDLLQTDAFDDFDVFTLRFCVEDKKLAKGYQIENHLTFNLKSFSGRYVLVSSW